MKYFVTLEIDDPEGEMGDSPPPDDLRAWARYLDLPEDEVMRLVKIEVQP